MHVEVVKSLLKIKAGDYSEDWGICSNIEFSRMPSRACEYWVDTREAAFMDWSKFSGDRHFPVPCGESEIKARYAYENFNKWSKRSKYGRDRWDLLDHLIRWYSAKAKESVER